MISPVLRKRPKNSKTLKTLHPLKIIHFIHFVQEGAYAPLSVTACGRATAGCQVSATHSEKKTSEGDFQPKHFLGRELIKSTTF